MSGCLYAIFCLIISASLAGRGGDESSVTPTPSALQDPVKIEVQELESSLQLGADRNTFTLRIGVRVSVTSNSATPIVVERDQFLLQVNGNPVASVNLPDFLSRHRPSTGKRLSQRRQWKAGYGFPTLPLMDKSHP